LLYNFEWDPVKARQNVHKHKVNFQRAAAIFNDPHAISIFDNEHSLEEDRWIIMGRDSSGVILVVCHTFLRTDEASTFIRIISSAISTSLRAV
jgi:uncharacterized protein